MKRLRLRHVGMILLCLVAGVVVALRVAHGPSPAIADATTATTDTTTTATDSTSTSTSTETTSTSTPTAPPTQPKLKRKPLARFTFAGGGDIALAGSPEPALFSAVRGLFQRADLAIGNLEGPLTTAPMAKCLSSGAANGCFAFRASPSWAATLRRAGFNDLNVANNHALDTGPDGQRETLAALRAEHLAYDGLPGQITYLGVHGVRVAVIGTAPYPWSQNLLDIAGGQALVRKAARHAQVVIVYMHAGAEGADALHVSNHEETYLGERRGNPVAFAHAAIDAGADLVFASGPHVLRAVQWYRHRLIAYSLGNLAGVHTLSTDGVLADSAVLRVTLDADGGFVAGSLVPLDLDSAGTPALDPRRRSIGLVRSLSREDFPRSAVGLSQTGTILRER